MDMSILRCIAPGQRGCAPGLAAALAVLLAAGAALAQTTTRPLNDTGITWSGHATSGNATTCDPDHPAGQDCHYGRDAAARAGRLAKVGGSTPNNGVANGFDFTALDANGQPTTPSAGANPHPCVRDNVTGLVWEVKTDDGGLRDKDWQYTWYDSVNNYDGYPGSLGSTSTCNNTLGGRPCNTQNYVAAVNAIRLCGYSDWRMPTVKELESIIDYGRPLGIDPTYFPNTTRGNYWSGSPLPNLSRSFGVWTVYFGNHYQNSLAVGLSTWVRLVRGGQ